MALDQLYFHLYAIGLQLANSSELANMRVEIQTVQTTVAKVNKAIAESPELSSAQAVCFLIILLLFGGDTMLKQCSG